MGRWFISWCRKKMKYHYDWFYRQRRHLFITKTRWTHNNNNRPMYSYFKRSNVYQVLINWNSLIRFDLQYLADMNLETFDLTSLLSNKFQWKMIAWIKYESHTHIWCTDIQTNRTLYARDDVLVISIHSTTENQIACTISCIAYIRNTKRWLQSIQKKVQYNRYDETRIIKPHYTNDVSSMGITIKHVALKCLPNTHLTCVYYSSNQSTTHETHWSPIGGFLWKLHISIKFMK